MFSHLTDFGRKRSPLGGVGFYLAYLVFVVVVGMALGLAIHTLMPNYSTHESALAATGFTVLVSLTLSLLIVQSKNLNTSIPLLLLSLCAAILAANGGALLGLIIPAAFSMIGGPGAGRRSPKKKSRKK
jgi:hypothetical protein